MGGTKCLRLGRCELKYMGGVLQNDSSIRESTRSRRARGSFVLFLSHVHVLAQRPRSALSASRRIRVPRCDRALRNRNHTQAANAARHGT
jgi:hypothetical protein